MNIIQKYIELGQDYCYKNSIYRMYKTITHPHITYKGIILFINKQFSYIKYKLFENIPFVNKKLKEKKLI